MTLYKNNENSKKGSATSEVLDENTMRKTIRVAVIGNVDSGKSTLVGVLSKAKLDDGRGAARAAITTLKHEVAVGRTSAVGIQLMAFDDEKQIVPNRRKSLADVVRESKKTISLIDLCGHAKYLKTTIFGLTGLLPDYALVLIGANMGIPRVTKEHLGIAVALGIPVVVVVTKIDIAPEHVYKETMQKVKRVLKIAQKMPYVVRSSEDVAKAVKSIVTSDRAAPVFCLSSVTGEGLQNLCSFLRLLPAPTSNNQDRSGGRTDTGGEAGSPPAAGAGGAGGASEGGVGSAIEDCAGAEAETKEAVVAAPAQPGRQPGSGAERSGSVFIPIDSVYEICGVGFVVSGTVVRGAAGVAAGTQLWLGPGRAGGWLPVVVRSIEVQRVPAASAPLGCAATFALRSVAKQKVLLRRRLFRYGMALVGQARVPDAAPPQPVEERRRKPLRLASSQRRGGAAANTAAAAAAKTAATAASATSAATAATASSLVAAVSTPGTAWEFEAEVLVLHHQTTIKTGYCTLVHCGTVRQPATVLQIKLQGGGRKPRRQRQRRDAADATAGGAAAAAAVGQGQEVVLRTGSRALVKFRFQCYAEYLLPGSKLLFREGTAKGVGTITRIFARAPAAASAN